MITLVLEILLIGILLLGIVLLKTYRHISAKELKRQARAGDALADTLYKVVGFGMSLDIVLWFVIGLSAAGLFTLLAEHSSGIIAFILIAILIWVSFAWLPAAPGSRFSRRIARYTARPLHFVIDTIYPLLVHLEKLITRHRPVTVHTGLYTKEDLIDLLNQQKGQLDNRIPKDELLIARNALAFGDKLVRDVMMPKRVMKTVDASDAVGPILMEEVHKSGHSRYPVYEDSKENFVGILHMRDMVRTRSGGLVKNMMEKRVYYVHDESPLGEALQAFIKTHHHMFLVVNNFEEVVGLITMEDVLEQVVGKPILDEFDQYDDLRAVAAKAASKEHKENHAEEKVAPKPPEVVE